MSIRCGATSTGPCASVLARVLPGPATAVMGSGLRLTDSGLASPRAVAPCGATYSTCTVLRLASLCCFLMSLASSPPMPAAPACLGASDDDALSAIGLLEGSLTEALRPSCESSSVASTKPPSLFTLLPMKPTTCVYSLSQLCRATSNKSARRLGSGTSIRRKRSRACGVTYSGKVNGVLTMYL